jgi:hypothetical protein
MNSSRMLSLILICLAFSSSCFAQTSPFDLAEYQQFLEQHRNMTSSELLQMCPAEDFKEDVNVPWESVVHHDLIETAYTLTDYEKSLLQKNGFVVTERLRKDSFIDQLLDIWKNDLPLFISTDAILHAMHYYYDTILMKIELGVLRNHLAELLSRMHEELPELFFRYSEDEALLPMFEDIDLYLTVPRRLLGESSAGAHLVDEAVVNEILDLIEAESLAAYSLFSQTCREIDFSQFTPRGHYTQYDDLKEYFQAMMWLGRAELYLLRPQNVAAAPCPPQSSEDIQRQTIDAVLITELMDLANVHQIYAEMEAVLSFLVGEQDNVTPAQLRYILDSVNIYDASQLLDIPTLEAFQETLKTKAFAFQAIQSQVLMSDPTATKSVQPASAFMLFGQRFVIDSYVTSNVVFDKIVYQGDLVCRLSPSTLDVMAGLGNNMAIELLVPELEKYHYSSNLAALRYLIDAHEPAFWDSSIYNMWLNSIRTLNPPANREHLPEFMQTAAWWHQKLNTQLASWAELRHDNLLYAKQSYSSALVCSYPCGYVEPFPEFFQCLSELAKKAHDKFANISFSNSNLNADILDYYVMLKDITHTLAIIAQKELDFEPLTSDEITFMQEMIFRGWYSVLDGWYVRLIYGPSYDPQWLTGPFSNYLVADYHTTPTDCAGNLVGWVSHAGTGPVDLAVVTAKIPDFNTAAFVGPVMSYYEYRTTGFQRLTDEEWETTYLSQATRPEWTSSFLANGSGESD